MISNSQNNSSETISQDFVLFGSLGDLSLRKLLPSFYHLESAGFLDKSLSIHCVIRDDNETNKFYEKLKESIQNHVNEDDYSGDTFDTLISRINCISLDLTDPSGYKKLKQSIPKNGSVTSYYFALPPSMIELVCDNLNDNGIINKESKIVIEKPIGVDYKSAKDVNDKLAKYFDEEQIYRIDHYLGKETVQNLIALRFANSIFASQWNSKCIEYIEITAAETIGIEGRWGYYDDVGQMIDMVQSHLLQLLCLVAIEPPNELNALNIRYEKEQVLKALTPIKDNIIRAQYVDGEVLGESVPGYLEEDGANTQSETETYICMRAEISNWRWSGTPFYLRTGKRLSEKVTQIIIHFKPDQHFIFDQDQQQLAGNVLIIKLQPTEGISLEVVTKNHGIDKGMRLRKDPLYLDFYKSQKVSRMPGGYEKMLLELLNSEQRMFLTRKEVELSWKWCDQVTKAFENSSQKLCQYRSGSNGPEEAKQMIEKYGHKWYEDR